METGAWTDSTSHISGGIDSYYEYLLKCWQLFDDEDCGRMWRASIDAVNKYLADETAPLVVLEELSKCLFERHGFRAVDVDDLFANYHQADQHVGTTR